MVVMIETFLFFKAENEEKTCNKPRYSGEVTAPPGAGAMMAATKTRFSCLL